MKNPFTPKTSSVLSRRRLMGHVALGGAVSLLVTACGGGSDGGSSGDGTSGQEGKLIATYDKLEQGMDWTDVEALVGFPANDVRGRSILIWVVGSVRLSVDFFTGDPWAIASATLKNGSNSSLSKGFDQ